MEWLSYLGPVQNAPQGWFGTISNRLIFWRNYISAFDGHRRLGKIFIPLGPQIGLIMFLQRQREKQNNLCLCIQAPAANSCLLRGPKENICCSIWPCPGLCGHLPRNNLNSFLFSSLEKEEEELLLLLLFFLNRLLAYLIHGLDSQSLC